MKKCVVVYNPHSGKHNKKMWFRDKFSEILSLHGYKTIFLRSKRKEHIIDIVHNLNDDIDLVISIGGDGTFNESIRGNFLREKRLVLAHLPNGTTNDVGTMYGYGRDLIANLKMLLEGEIRKVDIITINNIPSIYVCGFGKYLNIPYLTSGEDKKKFGYLAYIWNAFREFFKITKMREITYEVNGEKYHGYYSFMFCSNSTRIAGLQNIFNDIKLNDNKFEVLFCNIASRKKLINSLLSLATNDINHVSGLYYYKTGEVKIHIDNKKATEWDIDGEKVDIEEEDIDIKLDNDTCLMIPKKNIDKLFV